MFGKNQGGFSSPEESSWQEGPWGWPGGGSSPPRPACFNTWSGVAWGAGAGGRTGSAEIFWHLLFSSFEASAKYMESTGKLTFSILFGKDRVSWCEQVFCTVPGTQ